MGPKSKQTAPLVSTSQGKATDLPSPFYIPAELAKFGTNGTLDEYNVDLDNEHIFDAKTFDITNTRFLALEPALRLATNLLLVGLPYLASFLPKPRIYDQNYARRVWMNPDPGPKDIEVAWKILRDHILPEVTWREDPEMFDSYRLGVNHTPTYSGPAKYANEDEETWFYWGEEAEEEGKKVRPIIIVLASQFLDSIVAAPPHTERYMNALFAAAINIVHELGHTIYYAILTNDCGAIWVGDDLSNETGNSFISYIFNGFFPEPINLAPDFNTTNAAYREFRNGHEWIKNPRRPCKIPYAEVSYSIPMTFVQTLFFAESWKDLDITQVSLDVLSTARNVLCSPGAPFRKGMHARRATLVDARRRQLNPTYVGYEDVDDAVDDDEVFMIKAAQQRNQAAFIDEDWDDTGRDRSVSVQAERKGKFVDLSWHGDNITGNRSVKHPSKKAQPPPTKVQPPSKKKKSVHEKQPSVQVPVDFAAMRISELRVALEGRSLSLQGNKGDMVARLHAYDRSHGSSSESSASGSKSSEKGVGRPKRP